MNYQMYPARKKENIPALRWETLQHLSLIFFSPHYSFHTRAGRIKDQHRLPCSRILMSMGLVPAEKIRHN